MVKGADEIGLRASIWSNDFMVGAGAPGGVSEPCAKTKRAAKQQTNRMVCVLTTGPGLSDNPRRGKYLSIKRCRRSERELLLRRRSLPTDYSWSWACAARGSRFARLACPHSRASTAATDRDADRRDDDRAQISTKFSRSSPADSCRYRFVRATRMMPIAKSNSSKGARMRAMT